MIRYTKDEISNIKSKNIHIELSQQVIDIINLISKEVGAPPYVKTPMFTKKKKRHDYNSDIIATVIPNKPEASIEQKIQLILNKFNNKTYDKLKIELINLISTTQSNDTNDNTNNYTIIVSKLYKMVSIQSFNISLYGCLFKDLVAVFPELKKMCLLEYDNYIDKFENIKCASVDDYEEFVKNNEINSCIRTLSQFYVELRKHKILELHHITKLIELLQVNLNKKGSLDTPNENPCIEYTENLFILIIGSIQELKDDSTWDKIYNNLLKIKNIDKTLYKNINNKIKFKHMDMLDVINKL